MPSDGERPVIRVLNIEDNVHDTHLLTSWLKTSVRADFPVVSVLSNKEAIDILRAEEFDIVVSDLGLPDASGVDQIEDLRAVTALPIVIWSQDDRYETQREALRLGAQDVIVKGSQGEKEFDRALVFAIGRQAAVEFANEDESDDVSPEHSRPTLTAQMYGLKALSQRLPTVWEKLLANYCEMLDQHIESSVFRSDADSGDLARSIGGEMAIYFATPHDITELHAAALKVMKQRLSIGMSKQLVGASMLVLVRVMGELVSNYRQTALVHTAAPKKANIPKSKGPQKAKEPSKPGGPTDRDRPRQPVKKKEKNA